MKTVARKPESFTFFTPLCAVRTELVLLPIPHPLPVTLNMYTGTVLAVLVACSAGLSDLAAVSAVAAVSGDAESLLAVSAASLQEERSANAAPNVLTVMIFENDFNFMIL